MEPGDFVYMQTYKGCLAQNVTEKTAKDAAVRALNDYRKGKFDGKVSEMIKKRISEVKGK